MGEPDKDLMFSDSPDAPRSAGDPDRLARKIFRASHAALLARTGTETGPCNDGVVPQRTWPGQLQPGQVRPEAEVDAMPEREVCPGRAVDVEAVRVGSHSHDIRSGNSGPECPEWTEN